MVRPHSTARTDVLQRVGVRMLVANCSVEYQGRLGARLPPAPRLILLKADGSIAVHSDTKAYKPLNWMSPPCAVREEAGRLVATNPGGETLTIELHEVLHDYVVELGDDPGLAKDGPARTSAGRERTPQQSAGPDTARRPASTARPERRL